MNLEEKIKKVSQELDDTPITFGKYKGKTPDEISDVDPKYIIWLWEDTNLGVCSEAMYDYCLSLERN